MTTSAKKIIAQALELPAHERLVVAEQLLQSVNSPSVEMNQIWIEEAEARISAYEQGVLPAISLKEVLAKYDKK